MDDADDEAPDYAPESADAGELWCPECGAVLYADATRCPKCEDYVTPGAKPTSLMPAWIWAGIVLLVLAGMAVLLFR